MSVSRSEPVIGSTTVVTSKYRFFVCGSPFSIALDDFRNYLINAASTLRFQIGACNQRYLPLWSGAA